MQLRKVIVGEKGYGSKNPHNYLSINYLQILKYLKNSKFIRLYHTGAILYIGIYNIYRYRYNTLHISIYNIYRYNTLLPIEYKYR